MPASVRGDKYHARILRDGALVDENTITGFDQREDSQISDSLYMGAKKNQPDKAQMGWSMSFNMEVKNANIDYLIQDYNEAQRANVTVPSITVVIITELPGGEFKQFTFPDCVPILESEQASGIQDKVTRSLSFKSRDRIVG